ncbi:MAG: CdaR family protein [Acidobacteria bacterium]|nr:CdaR family protein [Acidobacteriota bacterium]
MNILREFLFNNIGLKAISLLLALLLWLQVAGQQTVQQKLALPVDFVNMAPETEISNDYVRRVDVVLSSRQGTSNFEDGSLTVRIDLRGSIPGAEKSYPLTADNISGRPSGVEVVSISPTSIRLLLENTVRKSIAVVPELVGEPAEGFQVTKVQAPRVTIIGPQSRVQEVSEAQTEPIRITGLSSTLVSNVAVDIGEVALRMEPVSVDIIVTIEEERREVQIRRIPIELVPKGVEATLMTRRVEILGTVPLSFSGELTVQDFQATVNVETLEPRQESYELAPQITLISDEYAGTFRLQEVIPDRIKVRRVR